jgi:hypothetical protein
VKQGLKDLEDLLVKQGLKDLEVFLGKMDKTGLQVKMVQSDHEVHLDYLVHRVHLVRQA